MGKVRDNDIGNDKVKKRNGRLKFATMNDFQKFLHVDRFEIDFFYKIAFLYYLIMIFKF